MNKKTQTILGVLLVFIIAGLVGFYIYNDNSKDITITEEESEVVVDITEDEVSITNDNNEDYKIEVIPTAYTDTPSIPVPDLDREIVFTENTSDEAKRIISEKINKLVKELKENSNLFQNWTNLGLYRKAAGDYEGARDAWEYIRAVNPKDSLSSRNLGDLYGYYLNDPQKAEENFLKAIETDPSQIEYYFKTAEFYREGMEDPTKARAIVQQGIESNPSSKELKSLLSSLE